MDTSIGQRITIGISFLAGLASFLSPCVFSLVPAYISYLSGRSIAANQKESTVNRLETFFHGLAFVLGFSIVFIFLGIAAASLGSLLGDLRFIISKIGGLIVILFGVHLTGILRIPFLEYDLHPKSRIDHRRSFFSSVLMGVFFSAGWSPCVGPVLGAILTFAVNGGSVIWGVQWLSAYSVGLAIPFLIAALSIGWVMELLMKYQKVLHYIEILMGVILIIVGFMLLLGIFSILAGIGNFINFGI